MTLKEIPKIPIEQLAEEVAVKLRETKRFRLALAFILDDYNIPIKMWPWYSSKVGTALNKRKRTTTKKAS